MVRYLPEKKFRLPLQLYCEDRARNLPGPDRNNVITVLQISSKSVYFRRNYSRTREHRIFAPLSISIIRPKLCFAWANNEMFQIRHS